MKIYSTQILMGVGFLGEMIYKMRFEWLLIFGISLTFCSIYNFIMELRDSQSDEKVNSK